MIVFNLGVALGCPGCAVLGPRGCNPAPRQYKLFGHLNQDLILYSYFARAARHQPYFTVKVRRQYLLSPFHTVILNNEHSSLSGPL